MVPSFEKRVRAFAIDTSGVSLLIIISLFSGISYQYLPYIITGIAIILFYFLPYFFSSGQTFGKRIQKIKIVGMEGENISIIRILLRDIFKLTLSVVTFGLYLVIAFFVMSDKTSQTIHDRIFKTKVIDLEKPTGKYDVFKKTESMRKRGL